MQPLKQLNLLLVQNLPVSKSELHRQYLVGTSSNDSASGIGLLITTRDYIIYCNAEYRRNQHNSFRILNHV